MSGQSTFSFPDIGTREGQELEFKSELNRGQNRKTDHFELAKDMAAFANGSGGHIIVGAHEAPRSILSRYQPMGADDATTMCKEYSLAQTQRLQPQPMIEAVPRPFESGFLPVISVEALPGQIVGVRVLSNEVASEQIKTPKEMYAFPLRSGDNCVWLQPEQLSMLMIPELRRTLLLLRQIGSEPVMLDKMFRKSSESGTTSYSLTKIDEQLNQIVLGKDFYIPLDTIKTVWRDKAGWRIVWDVGT